LVSCAGDDQTPGEFIVWDVAARRECVRFAGHAGNKFGIVFSPNGFLFSSAAPDESRRVWATETGELISAASDDGSPVRRVFTDETYRESRVAKDRSVRIRDPGEDLEVLRLATAPEIPTNVAFSSDRSLLACTTIDGALCVWDARRRQDLLRLPGHQAPLESVDLAPDGRLISRDASGAVLTWSPESWSAGSLMAEAVSSTLIGEQGELTADIDPDDPTVVRVRRPSPDVIPFDPWKEAATPK
jgi:WD40 repeat protein